MDDIKLTKLLRKAATKVPTLQFALYLPKTETHLQFSSTQDMQQRFHSASVGKLVTACIIFKAIEANRLSLSTKVSTILEANMMAELFVYKGYDYRHEVTIQQLLGHTSGVADYLSSANLSGSSFITHILHNPNRFWTPQDLVRYTQTQQHCVAIPGQRFFYSDTGYVLLGLVAEKIFGAPFAQLIDALIVQPCQLKRTTLAFYGASFDAASLAPMVINGTDIRLFRSLSCDFSGGGLSTTAPDLVRFLSCLYQGQVVQRESLQQMTQFVHQYRRGLYYGLGMMQVRFRDFFFLLRGLPQLQGHWGASGVHACYNATTGDCFVLNVGSNRDMARSFRLFIKILQTL